METSTSKTDGWNQIQKTTANWKLDSRFCLFWKADSDRVGWRSASITKR